MLITTGHHDINHENIDDASSKRELYKNRTLTRTLMIENLRVVLASRLLNLQYYFHLSLTQLLSHLKVVLYIYIYMKKVIRLKR